MDHRIDIDPLLRLYCEKYSTPERRALLDVERQTHLNTVKRHDASDALQGRLISFISKIHAPKIILEIGTFTGYATGWLAEGLAAGGKIISVEQNELFLPVIRRNLEHLGITDRVDLIHEDARKVIPTIREPIDLVFLDGAKHEYVEYFKLVINLLRPGGIIVADNILWKGRVLNKEHDRMTRSIHQFNEVVVNDARVEVVMLPYRDGISLIRKIQ